MTRVAGPLGVGGALPTLHDRYGLSTAAVVQRVRRELAEVARRHG